MSKRVYSNTEARRLSARDLFNGLCFYYRDPGSWEEAGLAEAADLIAEGKLTWSQVEQAIDDGWNPGAEAIYDFLGVSWRDLFYPEEIEHD
jgi:hypothetical protein